MLELGPQTTALVGANGEGKTTFVEAVHVLATLHSFRTPRLRELIRDGAEECRIEGEAISPAASMGITLRERSRKLQVNGKGANGSEFCDLLAVVALAPEHRALLEEGPAERRRYLDRLLFALDSSYWEIASRYRRAVAQKQALLREGMPFPAFQDQVSPWNEEIRRSGTEIRRRRIHLVRELSPLVQERLESIVPSRASLDLNYRGDDLPLERELEEKIRVEHLQKKALVGPHRDDLRITIEGVPAAERASQGERHSILLALKLAEADRIRDGRGVEPILLLDDIGATLDERRRERLLSLLGDSPRQALLTTADEQVAAAVKRAGGAVFRRVNDRDAAGFSFARWEAS